MAKTKEHELAKTPEPQGGAIAQYARPFEFEGEDRGDLTIPRIIIHQGDISEKEYGAFPKGTLMNAALKTKLESDCFVALGIGWAEWIQWGPERSGIVHRTRVRDELPPGAEEWAVDTNGKRIPPPYQKYWNFLVMQPGADFPIVFSLKRSSKAQRKCYNLIMQIERGRAAAGKPPMLWKIGTVDAENAKGKWKEPALIPSGDPPADLLQQVALARASLQCRTVNVRMDEPDHAQTDEYDPDARG